MKDTTSLVIPKEYIDRYNHVHYKDYITAFQNARTEFLAKRGITLADLERNRMHLVTRRIEIDYIRELLLGDAIKINTDIMRIGKTSMTFFQSIARPSKERGSTELSKANVRGDDRIVATCTQVFVLIDSVTRLKITIPEELCAKLLSDPLA